jgi:hypothetical protein
MKPARLDQRRLLLTAVSLLSLVALGALPANRSWVKDIVTYYEQVPRHVRTMGYAERMRARHYRNYAVIEYIASSLRPDDVLLLPPTDYVRRHYDPVYCDWSEPKYVYYMLGRRPTVTLDSPRVDRATCSVILDARGRPAFVRIDSVADLERLRATFGE